MKTGELVRLAGRFEPPMYPLVAVVSDDQVQIAYPRADELVKQAPRARWTVPAAEPGGEERWWPLQPPDGTLTFVVLASRTPLAGAGELESIRTQLESAGGCPRVGAGAMMRFSGAGGWIESSALRHARAIGPVEETVATPGSALARLAETLSGRFELIEALAVPQRSAE